MLRFVPALPLGAAAIAAAAPLAPTAVTVRTVEPSPLGGFVCGGSHTSALDAQGRVVVRSEADELSRTIRERFTSQEPVIVGRRAAARGSGLDVVYILEPAVANDPDFVAALEAAAAIWEAEIDDPITIYIEVSFVSDQGFIAAASSDQITVGYSEFRNAASADASPDEALYVASLPATLSIIGNGGGYTSNSSGFDGIDLTTANARALGFDTFNNEAVPDASIVFNTDFTFDTDPSDGVPADAIDTLYVMTHEIGHMLGFISSVDSFFGGDSITGLDVFRVGALGASNDPATLADWPSVQRETRVGEEAAFDPVDELPGVGPGEAFRFSTGSFFGDGRQASHWKDDVLLNIAPNIGVMDPTYEGVSGPGSGASPGYLTQADRIAFSAIGWDIALSVATPCPADLTGDQTVGADDLATLIGLWNLPGPADLDGSGAVDPADLALLVGAWGDCP